MFALSDDVIYHVWKVFRGVNVSADTVTTQIKQDFVIRLDTGDSQKRLLDLEI